MNEITSHLRQALNILDAQTKRIGQDLGTENDNLQSLIENRDGETRRQLTLLSESLNELHSSLANIRRHLVDGYAAAKSMNTGSEESPLVESEEPNPDDEVDLHPAEASEIRHDEPTTLAGIFRSLLMANEPGQRKRSGNLD